MHALKADVKKSGAEISDALNNAISPKQATDAITKLSKALIELGNAAKTPADNFRATATAITSGMDDVRLKIGLTKDQFLKLNEQLLQTTAQKQAERAFNDVARSAGLSKTEMEALGKQLGFTSQQMSKMGGVFGETNKTLDTQTSALGRMKDGWAMMAAGVASAMYIAREAYGYLMKGVELGELGAKVQRTEAAFYAVAKAAGISGEEAVKALQIASKGMMDESDIMVKASRLIQAGVPIATLTELMTLLVKQAPIVGDTLPEAWDKFGDALSRGKLKGVQNYVGIVDLEEAMKKYAASIGRTVEELTDESKLMITAEIVTAKLRDTTAGLGESQETAAEAILKAKVKMQEAHEAMAKEMIPVAIAYYNALTKILEAWNSLSNRPEPDWVKRQKAGLGRLEPDWVKRQKGTLGRGGSGTWEEAVSLEELTHTPADAVGPKLTFKVDQKALDAANAALKKHLDEIKKMEEKFQTESIESWGKYLDDEFARINENESKINQAKRKGNEDDKKAEDKFNEDTINSWGIMLDEHLDMLNESARAEAKLKRETVAQEQKNAAEIWKVQKSTREDIAKLTKNDFEVRIGLINDEYDKRVLVVGQTVELELWKSLKLREIYEEQALRQGTFWDGMKVQYDRNIRDQITWGEQGAAVWNKVMGKGGILEGTLNTFFDDLFNGELKTAEDYFKAFCESILKMFAQMIAQMIAQWAAMQLGNLVLGTGTGTGTGTSILSAVTGNGSGSNLSTVLSAAGSGYSALNGGIPLTGAGGTLSTWLGGAGATGAEAWLAASGGTSTSAGLGAAGSGIGAAAAGGAYMLAVWYAMVLIAGQIDKWIKGPWEDQVGGNPFDEGILKSNLFGGVQPGMVNTDFDNMAEDLVPNVDMLKSRFKKQFPKDSLPTGAFSTKGKMRPYWAWMSMQPEYGQAISNYQKWLADNYEWETSSSEGEASKYISSRDAFARQNSFSGAGATTYAAEGAYINEPMVAYGRSGKRIVMGEAGPEYIVPAGAAGQMIHLSLSLDTRVIGEAIYDLSKKGRKVVHQRGIAAN